jgi:hypothetical protein
MTNNILETDNTIRKIYESKLKQIPELKKTRGMIDYILENISNVSLRAKRKLEFEKQIIENEIFSVNFLKFYFVETREILERYLKEMKKQSENSFFINDKGSKESPIKKVLTNEYKSILYSYSKILQLKCQTTCNPLKISFCNICQADSEFYVNENSIICCKCLTENVLLVSVTTYNDNNRLNISGKYSYDRRLHFRECINQYQGKQSTIIPDQVLLNIKNATRTFGLENIKLNHIYAAMKYLGYTKYYDDVVLILYKVTGKKPDNIEYLEEKLIHDFNLILLEYDNLKQTEKKNLNTQYILFQLLKKHGHKCEPEHLTILKSNERKVFSENVCKIIFEKFGWEYSNL